MEDAELRLKALEIAEKASNGVRRAEDLTKDAEVLYQWLVAGQPGRATLGGSRYDHGFYTNGPHGV